MAISSFRFPNRTPLANSLHNGTPLAHALPLISSTKSKSYDTVRKPICSCLVQEWQSYLNQEESYGHLKKWVPSWYPSLNFVKIEGISPIMISFESSLHLLSSHKRIKVVARTTRKLWPSEVSDFPLGKFHPQWYHLGTCTASPLFDQE